MNGESIKISYKQILIAIEIIKKIVSVSLPVQTSYWIKRDTDQLVSKVKKIEVERNKLIVKHGLLDKETGQVVVEKTNMDYWKEYEAALEELVEVNINRISISTLAGAELSIKDISAIEFMLCEDSKIKVASNLIV
jgi:hypothetical protein